MKSILFSLIFLSIFASAQAQICLDIVYDTASYLGPVSIPEAEEFDDSISMHRFLDEMIGELHGQAHLEASIDSIIFTQNRAVAYLHTGRQYSHVKISFDRIDEAILRTNNIRVRKYERQPVDINMFRALQDNLLDHYENSGYPFVRAGLSEIKINADTICGKLTIDENRFYVIDSIHIHGDTPVKRKYLYRHLGIYPGDPYNESRLKIIGDRLGNSQFMTGIRQPEIEFMEETADMYIYPQNRQASSFSGIIGIMNGDSRNNKTRLAGDVELDLINAFRGMETISIHWQSPGNQVQQMDLQLGQPYIMGSPLGADLHLHMYRQDTTYMKTEVEAGIPFTMPGTGVIRVFGKTYGTSLITGESTAEGSYQVSPAAGVSGSIFGISFKSSLLDSRINPYRGREIFSSFGAGNKTVAPPSGYSTSAKERRTGFGEGSARLRWFIPVTPATTIMLANLSGIRFNIGMDKEDDFFFANELFLLGGLHSVRGFDEKSIAASSYTIQRIEFRYLFDQAGNMFLFFDGMAYRQKFHSRTKTGYPFGFGAGMTLDTRAGQFSITWAAGKEDEIPVSLRSAKIHLGIISRF